MGIVHESNNSRKWKSWVKIISEGTKGVLTIFPANWAEFGKYAGYIRNYDMGKNADMLIAFWDGKSKGTSHMIDIAERLNLIIHKIIQ